MLFGSDNWSGAAPEISENLVKHSSGQAVAYGDSELDKIVEERFNEVFETQCAVFFVGTGTAANSLAIAATMKPGGFVFCHNEAHIAANEGGAPEFMSGGGRLHLIDGKHGKIDPEILKAAAKSVPSTFNHLGQGTMVSITQATEAGSIYSLDEISAIAEIGKRHGLSIHMDGARFANALVELDCTPAEMTWKSGVDMVSFGATKNGCWCAEALIVLNRDLMDHFQFLRKRIGHLFSKSRFIAAQFEAYLQNDVWLKYARHSNAIGEMLQTMVRSSNKIRPAWPSQSNQVFFVADQSEANSWLEKGARFHPFPTPKSLETNISDNEQIYRLVAGFASTKDDVDALAAVINE